MSLLAAAAVLLVGAAGLVRGELPRAGAGASGSASSSAAPIVVGGAYIREPANGINAAAYFTIYNTSGTADQLLSVSSGAGGQTMLHTDDGAGDMQMNMSGLTVPAHGSLSLSPGKGHVMIEKLYGPLKAGQSVNLELSFAKAGQVLVTAPVIGLTAPAPSAATPR